MKKKILVILIVIIFLYFWHHKELETYWIQGTCNNESMGYQQVYGRCDDFCKRYPRENGGTYECKVSWNQYLTEQARYHLPFDLYKLF